MPCVVSDHLDQQQFADYGATCSSMHSPHPPQSVQPSSSSSPLQTRPPSPSPPPPPLDSRFVLTFFIMFFFLAGSSVATATGLVRSEKLVQIAQWFERLGPNAVYLYGLLYLLLEIFAVPAIPLTLGSGYLFGPVKGTITVSVASTIAATVSFLIARYGLRERVTKLAERYPRFRVIDRAIGKEGFRLVLLLRLSPLLPFAISNYLYGLTSVKLLEYALGSWLGMLPGTIAYVTAGAAVNALTDLNGNKNAVSPVLVIIGIFATVAVLTSIGKMAGAVIDTVDEAEPPRDH